MTPISGAALAVERACSEDLLRVGSDFSSFDRAALCVTLKREDPPDVELRVPDAAVSVHAAVGEELQEDPGLLNVEIGGDPIEWGGTFKDYGIETGATLSVLRNEEAAETLEEVRKLASGESCSRNLTATDSPATWCVRWSCHLHRDHPPEQPQRDPASQGYATAP